MTRPIHQQISLLAQAVADDIRAALATNAHGTEIQGVPSLGFKEAKLLAALADQLEALSVSAWKNDVAAVKLLCSLLKLPDLLKDYEHKQPQAAVVKKRTVRRAAARDESEPSV